MLWLWGPIYTPDEFYTPAFVVECVKCDGEECDLIHGWGFVIRFMWWGVYLAVMFDLEDGV